MTELRELLVECQTHGIRLLPNGTGGLTIDGPHESLTLDLIDRLKTRKSDLLAMLQDYTTSTELPDTAAVWREALRLLEGDAAFPPDVMDALRNARAWWGTDEPADAGHVRSPNPEIAETPASKPTCRSGSTATFAVTCVEGTDLALGDITHKHPECRSQRSWRHVWGSCYCRDCWPPTDPLAVDHFNPPAI